MLNNEFQKNSKNTQEEATMGETSSPPLENTSVDLSSANLVSQGINKKQFTIDTLLIMLGCLLMAFSAVAFFIPYNVVSGGFSGFAIALFWLYENTGMAWLTPGIVTIIMNIPLFIIAIKIKGRSFGVFSLIGLVTFSIFLDVFIRLDLPYHLAQITDGNELLSTLYGGATSGIGWGLLVRRGGSTGGSDMLSNILHTKYPLFNYGTILLMIDGFVVLFSGIVNAILGGGIIYGIRPMLFAFIAIFLTAMIADYIIVGKNRAVTYFIICDKPQEMAEAIMQNIRRGVTALTARGVYNNTDREVLVCVVKRSQAIHLKRLVFEVDKKAFIFANATSEVYGQGFLTDLK
ncbi:MAG: YitT family protein [Firmicutes bacterium]|nr:YitT family protein [Bacillota bacterium]